MVGALESKAQMGPLSIACLGEIEAVNRQDASVACDPPHGPRAPPHREPRLGECQEQPLGNTMPLSTEFGLGGVVKSSF